MPLDHELVEIIEKHRYYSMRGAFFGGATTQPLGAGVILERCRLPYLDPSTQKFRTARGLACVLTHECDIDLENERSFNDKLLVLPIIDFKKWYYQAKHLFGDQLARQIAIDIVKDQIFRVFFLPTIPNSTMEYGGILYLNEIVNTEVSDVREHSAAVCSLSSYSFRFLSYKIENHLLRPKNAALMPVH